MSNKKIQVVFLDQETLGPQTLLKPLPFEHELRLYGRTSPEQIAERIAAADIVITNKVPLRAHHLQAATQLKLIAVAATGTDIIDISECKARNILVSNIRNYAVHTVPEHVFALIFALRRNIVAYRESVKAGRWAQSGQFCYFDYPIQDLSGSTLGIIGEGVLGQSVAQIGRALGMNVLFSAHKGHPSPGRLYTDFDTLIAQSDVITLHCPLNDSTRDLIDDAEFERMKSNALLINTARGGLVNETALIKALRSGKIAGAGFDVTTPEPAPDDHPLIQLLDLPNFILTPHVAWASQEAVQSLADQLIDNIAAFQAGQPRNLVH